MLDEESANDAWANANGLNPEPGCWGFYSRSDYPAPSNGVGGFTWFITKKEMLRFVWEVVPPASIDRDIKRARAAVETCRASVKRFEAGELTTEELRDSLNDPLAGSTAFEWMGTFEDLTSGDHPYAMFIRASFHAGRAEDDDYPGIHRDMSVPELRRLAPPIDHDDIDDFHDFMGQWGI